MIKNTKQRIALNSILRLIVTIPILLMPILLFIFGIKNDNQAMWISALVILLIYYILNYVALMNSYGNERTDIQTKITWTCILLGIPGSGAYLYFVFAWVPSSIKKHFKESEILENEILKLDVSKSKISLLQNGEEKFEELFLSLEKAEKYINIQYFIMNPGILQSKLLTILKEKNKEGVKIRIIYDYFGTLFWQKEDIKELISQGIDIVEFRPVNWFKPSGADNWRAHHKSVIIDGNISFFGGLNFGDEYAGISGKYGDWLDVHYKCEGTIIDSLNSIFFVQWFIATKQKISHEYDSYPKAIPFEESFTTYEILYDSPDRPLPKTFNAIKNNIKISKNKIRIITPYIAFPVSFKDEIRNAINKGIEIELITVGRIDKYTAYYQGTFDSDTLTGLGVKVYRADDLFLHSKMFIFDNDRVIFGTSNLDYRAFFQHFELNIYQTDGDINNFIEYFEKIKKLSTLQITKRKDWSLGRSAMYFIVRFFKGIF